MNADELADQLTQKYEGKWDLYRQQGNVCGRKDVDRWLRGRRIKAVNADRICVEAFGVHPYTVWGDDWINR